MRFKLPLLAVPLLLTSLTAYADTITTFDAAGMFASGSKLSGQLTIDTTTGVVTSVNLGVTGPDNLLFTTIGGQSANTPTAGNYHLSLLSGSNTFNFELPVGTLVGYTGGLIASTSNPESSGNTSAIFFGNTGTFDYLTSGSVAPTPEPSSVLLLGTGVLGMAGVLRKRFAS